MAKFNKLDVPHQWKDEFTKYPHGYTIFEALCKWVKQVDNMVDNINNWNDYLDNFVLNFDVGLQEEVQSTIERWQNEGLLDDIIESALNTELASVKTQLADKANVWEVLKKSEGVGLNDAKPDLLAAIEGGAGTSFNLLSIPRNQSVSPIKTTFFTIGKNLFNPETVNKGYVVDSNTGELIADETWNASDYIEVEPSTTYFKTGGYSYAFYDENKTYISGGSSNPFTTPSTCFFVRINIGQSTDLYTYQLEKGSVATPFEPFRPPFISKDKLDKISLNDINNLWVTNLYDKKKVLLDTSVRVFDGKTVTSTGFVTTDYVPVEGNTQYTITRARVIAYYDKDKKFISGITTNIGVPVTFTTPLGAKYLRTHFYPSTSPGNRDMLTVDQMQIVKGAELQPYRPYNIKFIPNNLLSPKNTIINLPPKMYGVANKEINIYFKNIVKNNLKNYFINVICTKGRQEEDRWTYTPSEAELFYLIIELCDDDGFVVTRAMTVVDIKAENVGNDVTKTALVIGDSTVNAGIITQRMLDNFSADVMNLTLIGSRGSGLNKHEGRGGWGFATYRKGVEYSGVINPFYDGNDFNFNYYMTQKGYAAPDYVLINLGINDVFAEETDEALNTKINQMLIDCDFIIASIQAYNDNIKIGLCITIPPNDSQYAFGASYGCGQTQWRYKRNNAIWTKRMVDYYKNREAENIYLVPINTNIDTKNGFSINNAVHPNDIGYNEIGDIMYYFLKSFEV